MEITKKQQKEILSLYKSLNIPSDYWTPPLTINAYTIALSDRSRAKTTNSLLMCMCIYWVTGYDGVYLRHQDSEITESKNKRLFNVIREYHYISKITGGEYDDVMYKRATKEWYFIKHTEDGEIIQADEPFLTILCLYNWETYKSSLVMHKACWLIFDEFIKTFYSPDEFIHLSDLLKTIFRDRDLACIYMLSNTIDKETPYFKEMMVYEDIKYMRKGDKATIETPKGTILNVELLPDATGELKKKRDKINRILFGFENKKLSIITGDGDTWNIPQYPHIINESDDFVYLRNVYIRYYTHLLRVELVSNKRLGLHCNVMRAKAPKEDTYIIINETPAEHREVFGFEGKVLGKIETLYNKNKWYYSDNDVGNIVENFMNSFY